MRGKGRGVFGFELLLTKFSIWCASFEDLLSFPVSLLARQSSSLKRQIKDTIKLYCSSCCSFAKEKKKRYFQLSFNACKLILRFGYLC